MTRTVHYIDTNTRVRFTWSFFFGGYVHVLERKRKCWLFVRWQRRAAIYHHMIRGKSTEYLFEYLLWAEKEAYPPKFKGYQEGKGHV